MEAWLEYAVRQFILYSLPVMVSLTVAGWIELQLTASALPEHPLHALNTPSAWALPLIAIAVHQPVVLALGKPLHAGLQAAASRFLAHVLLLALGFVLYAWALGHQPPGGMPPLHQWWAKVLMYFNLCVVMAHLLPLPGLLMGEAVGRYLRLPSIPYLSLGALILLSITPLLNLLIGKPLIYPAYAQLARLASSFAH
jgi:hypothetical protein